ncbi:MAG: GTPase [archaeon]
MRVRYEFSSRRTGRIEGTNKHRKSYPSVAREVIRISDIVLEILDARFIEETRNSEFEALAEKSGKKIVYVLNKADLVDINEIKRKIELQNMQPYVFVSCKTREGISDLRDKIKIEVKKLSMKYKRAHVGVIGYPNTGKSSVINMLVGRPVARTAAEAGFTRGVQKLRLATGILILDTPGVIPEKETGTDKRNVEKHSQIGVKTWDKVKEPEMIVFGLMKKYPEIEKYYGIECAGDVEVLIENLGRKLNFLRKGGIVDNDKTARRILRDWQEGKITS